MIAEPIAAPAQLRARGCRSLTRLAVGCNELSGSEMSCCAGLATPHGPVVAVSPVLAVHECRTV